MSSDREQIGDLLVRYATALDTRDWGLLDCCFTEDAVADYGPLGGRNEGREAIRGAVAILAGFDRTHHLLGNITISIDADEAQTTCYLQAQHVIDGDLLTIGGVYHDRVVRTDAGWRIAHRQLEPVWQNGDADLINAAARRASVAGVTT
jgi:3-phenylpropionate/cinnamic acid dioxygenase small subunit